MLIYWEICIIWPRESIQIMQVLKYGRGDENGDDLFVL